MKKTLLLYFIPGNSTGMIIFSSGTMDLLLAHPLKAEQRQDYWTSTRRIVVSLGECSCDKAGDPKSHRRLSIALVTLESDASTREGFMPYARDEFRPLKNERTLSRWETASRKIFSNSQGCKARPRFIFRSKAQSFKN